MNQGPAQAPQRIPPPLRQILDRLARPIDYASQSRFSRHSIVKNLEAFVSNQVIQALAETVHPPDVEANLLALRELFREEEISLTPDECQTRYAVARNILSQLYSMTGISSDVVNPHTPTSRIRQGNVTNHMAEDQPIWSLSIQYAKGVGPKRASLLEKLGIGTIEDAMWYLPWRYEDRSTMTPICQLKPGGVATITGVIQSSRLIQTRRQGMTLFAMIVRDDSGIMEAVYFNQPYLEHTLPKGANVIVSGMVAVQSSGKFGLQMKSPQYEVLDEEEDELLHVGRVTPIYHETRGITSRQLRRIIKGVLACHLPAFPESLPLEIRQKHHLPVIQETIYEVHFPRSNNALESLNTWTTLHHRRLAFEECFLLQLALAIRQRLNQDEAPGLQCQDAQALITRLRAHLPYSLTQAQLRVIEEIRQDMMSPRPMNRLVQGDVGSGKTVVALHAMAIACKSGYQAVLMAPTEILAEQHFLSMKTLLQTLGLNAVFVKGGTLTKERVAALKQIAMGDVQVVIGTHALIQQGVAFAKLGLVVVDEQHKFGVLQRAALRAKGLYPDVLVMTATPIPRTLAMTAYGDLHVSVIDQMPPGRKPIQTLLFRRSERKRAYAHIREHVKAGCQAYVVYPLVEESEKVDLEAALQEAERLQMEEFPAMRVGLLHGRMKSVDKARTMAIFKEGGLDILVATTVIEVGLDVPNATIMLIEHAERFGLAQLHQLRGRVGRGKEASMCLLVSSAVRASPAKGAAQSTDGKKGLGQRPSLPLAIDTQPFPTLESPTRTATQSAHQRLLAMVHCADGFAIAEQDLRIRGPGEFLGVRQSGVPELRVVDLVRDGAILEQARQEAFALIERDPELTHPGHRALKMAMLRRWQTKFDLGTVG